MSFILEALRKSENERQRLSNTAIADLPIGRRAKGQPWWVFVVAALLVVNLLVLVAVLLRDRVATTASPTNELSSINASTAARASNFSGNSAGVPIAGNNNASTSVGASPSALTSPPVRPLTQEAAPAPQVEYETVPRTELELANAGASVPDGPTLVRPIEPRSNNAPTATTPSLQDMHIDLHVYSKNPHESFVLINMRRYTEGQRLPEGPMVEQITPTGVVLSYNGERYQLNRN